MWVCECLSDDRLDLRSHQLGRRVRVSRQTGSLRVARECGPESVVRIAVRFTPLAESADSLATGSVQPPDCRRVSHKRLFRLFTMPAVEQIFDARVADVLHDQN